MPRITQSALTKTDPDRCPLLDLTYIVELRPGMAVKLVYEDLGYNDRYCQTTKFGLDVALASTFCIMLMSLKNRGILG